MESVTQKTDRQKRALRYYKSRCQTMHFVKLYISW